MAENEKLEQAGKAGSEKADKAKKDKKSKPGIFERASKWLREMKSELKKVQWPTWKQVLKNTGIVILCVVVIGVFIWVFDALAHLIIDALLGVFS